MGSTVECSLWQVPMSLSAANAGTSVMYGMGTVSHVLWPRSPVQAQYAIVQMEDLRALNGLPPFGWK